MDTYVAASQQEPQPASTMVTNDIDKSLSIPQRPHLQVRACMRALFAAAARARTCTCALVHAYSRAVTLPPFLAAPSTPLRFLLASPTSPPHLAAPPRRPTLPPRFAAPSSPPHLATKVRLSVLATPPRRFTTPLHVRTELTPVGKVTTLLHVRTAPTPVGKHRHPPAHDAACDLTIFFHRQDCQATLTT